MKLLGGGNKVKNRIKKNFKIEERKKEEVKKNLTEEQKKTLDIISDYLIDVINKQSKEYSELIISGYAGTGKTYLLSQLLKLIRGKIKYKCCSFTGKAVNILKEKGIDNTSTLHSLIYKPIENSKGEIIDFEFDGSIRENLDVLIIDEYSMLKEEYLNDLLLLDIPIIFFGDFFQLPPIEENTNRLFKESHIVLKEIQRNSGPLVKYATQIRNNEQLPFKRFFEKDDNGVFFGITFKEDERNWFCRLLEFDKIICGTNRLKNSLNAKIRKELKLEGELPHINETIMCIKNIRDDKNRLIIANGEEVKVKEINISNEILDGHRNAIMKVENKEKENFLLRVSLEKFYNPETDIRKCKENYKEFKQLNFFDFSYAVTAHKMQGDQSPKVLVLGFDMVWMKDDYPNIIYSAITRAEKGCLLVMNNRKSDFNLLNFNEEKYKTERRKNG